MNLGFTPEHEALRAEFVKLLASGNRRAALAQPPSQLPADAGLWRQLAEGGWLAAALPETCGGSGLDTHALCVLAEEAGRALVAVPFVASACAFAHGLRLADPSGLTAAALAPALVSGAARGVLLSADVWAQPPRVGRDADGTWRLDGHAHQVPDGASVTHALACVADADGQSQLVLLALRPQPAARIAAPLDLLHPGCDLALAAHQVQPLASGAEAEQRWQTMRDVHAVLVAFEQLGGAEAALHAAQGYSLQRYAFGRAIGSFQSLKHLMADMLVAVDLARSNCVYGAAVIGSAGAELSEAAAVARISASEAFRLCAAGSTQVHGALGVTWEADCHLYYRRAQALAGHPGSLASWKQRLVELLLQRRTATA